jgi:hypothetical protein
MSGARREHAVAAFLQQEFGASAAAIIGFVDILIEDARRHDLTDFVPDLERIREAGVQLSALIAHAVALAQRGEGDTARLRHDLRTPLNAIKGYGELLVEEARDSGRDTLRTDLGKVPDRLLGEIDRIGETACRSANRRRRHRIADDKTARRSRYCRQSERRREPHPCSRRQCGESGSASAPPGTRRISRECPYGYLDIMQSLTEELRLSNAPEDQKLLEVVAESRPAAKNLRGGCMSHSAG